MMKYFVLGFGFCLAFFFTYKLLKNPTYYKKWSAFNKIRLVILAITFFIGGAVFLFYQFGSNKGIPKNELLDIIRKLDSNEIESIKLYSYSKTFFYKFPNDTIVIIDTAFINLFTQKFKELNAQEYGPPIPIWKLCVLIDHKAGYLTNIQFEITKKENGKCAIWIIKKHWFGEFNLGIYSNDELGKLIEDFHFQYSD